LAEVIKPPSATIREILDKYKEKLEGNILPPDPARIIEWVLRFPVEAEHILPIPPILENIHSSFTRPLVESLPRLPMTADYHEFVWMKWIKEEFKV
jgi:hypothetical protein